MVDKKRLVYRYQRHQSNAYRNLLPFKRGQNAIFNLLRCLNVKGFFSFFSNEDKNFHFQWYFSILESSKLIKNKDMQLNEIDHVLCLAEEKKDTHMFFVFLCQHAFISSDEKHRQLSPLLHINFRKIKIHNEKKRHNRTTNSPYNFDRKYVCMEVSKPCKK